MTTARALGFDLAGVAAAADHAQLRHFPAWIAAGHAGEMHYLARRKPAADEAEGPPYLREDLRHAFPWARSVVCCGLNYNTDQPRSIERRSLERGWISRYAWGDDYHPLMLEKMRELRRRLQAEAQSGNEAQRAYVDTGPVVERVYARQAGLGWTGKNTCLINQGLGSFFFLGTLVCSFEIAADEPAPDRCGSCTRCIEACPTRALEPYRMDASRCIAYLNIELRGPIPESLRQGMGQNVVGCDICQDVCPWNRRAPASGEPALQPHPGLVHPELEMLASLGEAEYRERFRGSAVKRVKWAGWRRNVAVAMGNSGNPRFRARLKEWCGSEDPVLAEHAQWALRQLDGADENQHEN